MENVINIQLTVTDDQLSKLIKGKIEELPDEKIQEIFSGALSEFLKSKSGQELFYTKDSYYAKPEPSKLLYNMISNAVSKDLLKPCVDDFIKFINENYENLIKDAIQSTFSSMFLNNLSKSILDNSIMKLQERVNNMESRIN